MLYLCTRKRHCESRLLPDHPLPAPPQGWLRPVTSPGRIDLACSGDWVLTTATVLDGQLTRIEPGTARLAVFDLGALGRLDTVGAWLIQRTRRLLEHKGLRVDLANVPEQYAALLETIGAECPAEPVRPAPQQPTRDFLERVGRGFIAAVQQGTRLLAFFGMVCEETALLLFRPRLLRGTALITQIEQTGLNALPILGLLTFLIGIVLAFQASAQLRRFGADLLTVNLLGISILREIGGLIAAIIVAGRSGSAFTAEIGSMKVNEELDALGALGMNLVEIMVLPRVLGLIITLPLLTLFADMMGLAGGAVMCDLGLGISVPDYLNQLKTAVGGTALWIGLVKAPVFAFLIAMVGCFEGLRVERNATSVGRLTTQSVVESIFLVIVADALFSILFAHVGF
jgi:phospholipid/cholesterol/gamma-HCH transport system permease protein